jgi:TonB family protein
MIALIIGLAAARIGLTFFPRASNSIEARHVCLKIGRNLKYKSSIATLLLALFIAAACAQTTDSRFSVSVQHFVAPAYPVAAWLARVQGTVSTEVIIKPDGTVDSVKLISAHPMFREPVETALKQWSFGPISMATTRKITIRFQLDADCPLTGSQEPDKRYYVQTRVSADLPSKIDVTTCLPITTINSSKS